MKFKLITIVEAVPYVGDARQFEGFENLWANAQKGDVLPIHDILGLPDPEPMKFHYEMRKVVVVD